MLKEIHESEEKLRVAAYCRVSTAKEEQESRYKTQVAYFKEVTAYHPNWEKVEWLNEERINPLEENGEY